MKYFLYVMTVLFQFAILSSCSMNEVSKLDAAFKATIEENNCLMKLTSSESGEQKNVVIETQCQSDSTLFYGKIMYDFINNLEANDVQPFDNYSIKSANGYEVIKFSGKEAGLISMKKRMFDNLLSDIAKGNHKKVYDLFNDDSKSLINLNDFKSSLEPWVKNQKNEFEGFAIIDDGSNRYISFAAYNGNVRVLFTLSLNEENKIYGYYCG